MVCPRSRSERSLAEMVCPRSRSERPLTKPIAISCAVMLIHILLAFLYEIGIGASKVVHVPEILVSVSRSGVMGIASYCLLSLITATALAFGPMIEQHFKFFSITEQQRRRNARSAQAAE